jgi:hypothetical protein
MQLTIPSSKDSHAIVLLTTLLTYLVLEPLTAHIFSNFPVISTKRSLS